MKEVLEQGHEGQDQAEPKVKLQSFGEADGYDESIGIQLNGVGVGNIGLSWDEDKGEVMVWDFELNEDQRGKGFGKAARKLLLPHIIQEYPAARLIYSTIEALPAIKSAVSTPIPDGWERRFSLIEDIQGGNQSRIIGETDDPSQAVEWVREHEPLNTDEHFWVVGVQYLRLPED